MGRFFNREAALVAAAVLVAALGVGFIAELRPWLIAAITVASVVVLHLPLTITFQSWALEYYIEHGNHQRALALAMEIRDSAMVRSDREKATLDVAFVHLSRGDYRNALENLRRIVTSNMKPTTRAVVEASTGYALAHLEDSLPHAEELVQGAAKAVPQEPLFGYFLALIRLKQNRAAEAKDLIVKSMADEPDQKLPYPGERHWAMGMVQKALGDAAAARAEFEKARAFPGRFADLAGKELGAAPAAEAPKPG